MLTLDTSGLLAALDKTDPHASAAVGLLRSDGGPYLVPAGALAEMAFMIEKRLRAQVLDAFLEDLQAGSFLLDCGEVDLPRIRELIRRYADLPLGFADAAVISCAERNGKNVLSFDFRHFPVVARDGTIRLVSLG